jgi:DNA-binding NarL/FixJ family response regulator
MNDIVIVDYPLVADSLALLVQTHTDARVTVVSSESSSLAPPNSIVLIELLLPEQQCGLSIAQHLIQSRPDTKPVVWTIHPPPIAILSALISGIPSMLDKAMSTSNLAYWLKHVAKNGAAFPGALLAQARQWEEDVASTNPQRGALAVMAGVVAR